MNNAMLIDKLCEVYNKNSQIGLVMGAGVSKDSGIPLYRTYALLLFENSRSELIKNRAPREGINYLDSQLQSFYDNSEIQVAPEKVIQFVENFIKSEDVYKQKLKKTLFQNCPTDIKKRLELSHEMVFNKVYKENKTLNAIISFCAAIPSKSGVNEKKSRWDANQKIGAILTTNYDNLLEGSFGTKYGKKLLKPVARPSSTEYNPKRNIIPVYHMHGYISYIRDKKNKTGVKASGIIAAETDYYNTFYNHLAFNNIIATSFLRRYPSIFIGCSMQDLNIRRILYQLQKERIAASDVKEHFAIIDSKTKKEDKFEDTLLKSLGVKVIRVPISEMGMQVENMLKQVYISTNDITESTWEKIKEGSWSANK